MKSLANDLFKVVSGLCKDIQIAYPAYGGISKDSERLSRLVNTRGIGLFGLDLPSLDAILKDGVERGRLVLSGPLSKAVSKKIRVPRLFSGLWLRVFNKDGSLKQDFDTTAFAFLTQALCLGKKASLMCSPQRLTSAVKEYVDVEHQLRPPTLKWAKDVFDPHCSLRTVHLRDSVDADLPLFPKDRDGNIDEVLGRCQQIADLVLGRFDFLEPVAYSGNRHEESSPSGFKHGPGAVSDRHGVVNKYDFPRWSEKLESWFPYRDCGTLPSDTTTKPLNHEVSSKLIAVAKTAKAPRLIASEPTEHQWCQQLVLTFMKEQMNRHLGDFITLQDQRPSGLLALVSSRTKSLATVDLSSASDRLTCFVVERIFRKAPSLLHAMHACRTRSIRINIPNCPSETLLLKKFASQGTAVTFPVQSIVFLILALGVSIQGPISWKSIRGMRGLVRVFGDDIIIPTHGYDSLVQLLHHLQLKVNESKSFNKGPFRESCGIDGLAGDNVTPLKPEKLGSTTPESRQSTLDTSNNLFLKGFWHASESAMRLLPSWAIRSLRISRFSEEERSGSGQSGLVSFSGEEESHLRCRWNSHLQRKEVRTYRLMSKTSQFQPGERYALLQWLNQLPPQDSKYQNGVSYRPKTRDGLGWEPAYSL
jgi:hypothetical protein